MIMVSKTLKYFFFGVLLTGIVVGVLGKTAIMNPYASWSGYLVPGVLFELTLFIIILLLDKVMVVFSRKLRENAYLHAWFILNLLLVLDLLRDYRAVIEDNGNSLAGVELVLVVPVAITLAVIYTIFRSQKINKKASK